MSPVKNWIYAMFVKSTDNIPPEILIPAKTPSAIEINVSAKRKIK